VPRAAREREGVVGSVPRGTGEGAEKGGRHGTDAMAPGCSDSGGRCKKHGCGGCGCDRGGQWGTTTWAWAANKRGAMTRGPVVAAGCTRECE
jgi:hypothetical protein